MDDEAAMKCIADELEELSHRAARLTFDELDLCRLLTAEMNRLLEARAAKSAQQKD